MRGISLSSWKRRGIYVLLVVSLFFLLFYPSGAMTKEEGVQLGFEASLAQPKEFSINAHVNIPEKYMNETEAMERCWVLAKELGILEPIVENNISEGDLQVWITGKIDKDHTIVIMAQSLMLEELKESNLIVEVSGDYEEAIIDELGQKIKEVLQTHGVVELTSWVSGTYEGKIKDTEAAEIVKRIMEAVNAKEIEGIREPNIISIVGYSDKMTDWISYGGKKVNVNIAIRYNAYEGKTYLWIGSPLITIGY